LASFSWLHSCPFSSCLFSRSSVSLVYLSRSLPIFLLQFLLGRGRFLCAMRWQEKDAKILLYHLQFEFSKSYEKSKRIPKFRWKAERINTVGHAPPRGNNRKRLILQLKWDGEWAIEEYY
jgi:hypothetical protein